LLRGETQEVLQALEARMMAHSDKLEFEQAAEVRNQIQALSRVLHQQAIETLDDKDVDILAVRVQGGRACVNLAMVRGGRHLGDRPYFPVHVEDAAAVFEEEGADGRASHRPPVARPVEALVLEAFIAQHYIGVPVPPLLVTSVPVDKALLDALTEQSGVRVNAIHQPREQRRAWLDMAQKNADLQLARLLAEEGSQQARTRAWPRRWTCRPKTWTSSRDRVLRHLAHRGRSHPGIVRGVSPPQDAEQRIPALQDRGHHRRRRLRRHAPGAHAPLQQGGRGRSAKRAASTLPRQGARWRRHSPKAWRACPIWCSSTVARARWAWRARCSPPWGWTCRASWAWRRARAARWAWKSWCLPMGAKRSTWARTRPR
jgi:hypothetical protein